MANPNLSDALLVNNYIAGDEKSLEILIDRHKSRIYRHIYSKIADRDVSDDLFQETFFKVIQSLKSKKYYNEEGKFLAWVLRIANNLVMDKFRNDKKMLFKRDSDEYSVFASIKDNSLDVESKLIKNQVCADLNLMIQKLPAEQKEVVMLRFYSELSFKEIADITGVGINTTLGRMRYAMANLRKLIEKNKIYLPV